MNGLEDSVRGNLLFHYLNRLLNFVLQLLHRRTILLLAILFLAGTAAALWNMSRLSSNLIHSQAIADTVLYVQTLDAARTYYSTNAVDRVKGVDSIAVTPHYTKQAAAIPVPSTFMIELGQTLSQQTTGISVRLYSDYPFPWRRETSTPKDEFEQQALIALRQQPDQPFIRFESFQGLPSLRFAQADIMKPSCVACHNTYPDSPKRDWKVGDVGGVLTVTTPLNKLTRITNRGLQGTFVMLGGLLLLALLGIMVVISRLRHTSQELELRVVERTAQLQAANRQVQAEQEKSERLLMNILPEPIAQRLKDGHSSIADGFSEATILFADLVNFTELSAQITPTELVAILNEIFSSFDRLTETYELEKIKTIGDAYMVVGGLPNPRVDHAEAIAEMALDMRDELARFNRDHNQNCQIRIGINTGPVVAGVIGTKKFIYDLWGDTVNVASRMESQGLTGKIQVSATTYERLKHRYVLKPRGTVYVKGKGEMETFLLNGRQLQPAVVAAD